jgi:hypothetical protein
MKAGKQKLLILKKRWFDIATIVDFIPQSGTINLASVQLPMGSLKSNFVSVVKSPICSETQTENATHPNIAKDW